MTPNHTKAADQGRGTVTDVTADPSRRPEIRIRRHPERASYDAASIQAILDEALISHVGVLHDDTPFVLPMLHARVNDRLYLHGSTSSRLLQALCGGARVCVTATVLDGLVLARSAFNHSLNYRSVVVVGEAREVTDPGEREQAMRALLERVSPGRWQEVRHPTANEDSLTAIVSVPLHAASAKMRSGPPKDKRADVQLPVWAGEVPLHLVRGDPVEDHPSAAGETDGMEGDQ